VKPKCLFLILGLSLLPVGAKAMAGSVATYHWGGDFTAKVEALALMQSLNAQLLSHDSATLTLDHWCAAHKLAAPARIVTPIGQLAFVSGSLAARENPNADFAHDRLFRSQNCSRSWSGPFCARGHRRAFRICARASNAGRLRRGAPAKAGKRDRAECRCT